MSGSIQRLSIDTIRTLSMDAVQAANSGHPGTPMALAPVAYAIWQNALRYDPANPSWPDRDRFVLSCGHASMLLYSLLHLTGVRSVDAHGKIENRPAVSLDDVKNFRQLDSKTPGHPEYRWTTGVETTTGPLGQGVATSVGMAIAGSWLATRYNRPGFELFSHRVYALCGDGDLMEGVSAEASSLAGHLKLGNLCWIYDNNRITIEGHTDLAFSEDVVARFQALGWRTRHVTDANDVEALTAALADFARSSEAPMLIIVDSHIGYGSPNKQDSHSAHGEPLGEAEIALTKRGYGWPEEAKFLVPDGVREHFAGGVGARGAALQTAWNAMRTRYAAQYPAEAAELQALLDGTTPRECDVAIPIFPADAKGMATREAGGKVLNAVAAKLPWLVGGSADLAPSTKTLLTFDGAGHFGPHDHGGRNLHFGIREFAMSAACNGMALSGLRAYGASFMVFTDYARPAIRLAALMELPVVFIFTHDSIGLGEDGPTHQPVEHLASLRAIPNLIVMRPADANEVAECWRVILPLRHEPVLLALSRQAVPTIDRSKFASASQVARGAYVLADAPSGKPDVILIGSGTEVALCLKAWETLVANNVQARVVSMPSWELFERQAQGYRDQVLPPAVSARVAVEAASPFGWERWVGAHGRILGVPTFGASAPIKQLYEKFGLTPDAIARAAQELLTVAR
ncbi:MAG: transketolase [Acidobacteriota bacterium]